MIDGITGRQIQGMVFIGPVNYQRLWHLVDDKVHARDSGPVDPLTRQPTDGRNKDGGLRFGEMERDCENAHGVALTLKKNFCDLSDGHDYWVCADPTCGSIGYQNERTGVVQCPKCKRAGEGQLQRVKIPHTFKLLTQELQAMCIDTRILLK